MISRWIVLLVSCVIIYGCSERRPNQQFVSLKQTSTSIDKDLLVVEFRGSGLTSYRKAKEYALKRAAEATLARGCKYFKVVKEENISTAKNVKSVSEGGVENFALFNTTSQDYLVKERSPGVKLYFECYKNNPKIFSLIDAEDYLRKQVK